MSMTAVVLADPTAPALTNEQSLKVDEQLIKLWLHGRSRHTIRAYQRDIERLRIFVGYRPISSVVLQDLQDFSNSITGKPASKARVLASVKSLLSFAKKVGLTNINPGTMLLVPKQRDGLADRILIEEDVSKMLALSTGRDHLVIRLLYNAGFRISELRQLRWSDINDDGSGIAYVTVTGKREKTRTVRISTETARLLRALRIDVPSELEYVFVSRNHKALSPIQAWRIVKAAAKRAGIQKDVSPHFLRHSHASHAIERGCKVTTVRDTLGHSSIAVTDRYAHARPGESSGDVLAV